MRIIAIIASICTLVVFTALREQHGLDDQQSLQSILIELGEKAPSHYIANPDSQKVRIGAELVHKGRAKMPDGTFSRYISKFYVCTECHNQVQEDPVPSVSDPEARLGYAIEHDLPFLQATTFWGMVNRETWYNDDYVLKYGSLVEAAHESLEESTQLCARECSSGRYLDEWELEALLHYYNTIGLTIGELHLDQKSKDLISEALNDEKLRPAAIAKLKEHYALRSPATFSKGSPDWSQYSGDSKKGEALFKASCMTCHRAHGPSQLILDTDRFTLNKFKRNQGKDSWFDLQTITRYGTHAEPGHRQYMPLYPLERMSNQQLADLRAFVLEKH